MAETIIAKIQVRRGELDDLPVLDEGEFGYAVDYRRLFIGNTPLEFITDGVTRSFTISDKSLIPGQMIVRIDGVQEAPGINFNIDDTDIVWNTPPAAGKVVSITYNTEVAVVNNNMNPTMEVLQLGGYTGENPETHEPIYLDVGLNWNIANGNSAIINYSLANTNGDMHIGSLKLITNANIVTNPANILVGVTDIGGGIGNSGITFDARVADNRVYLTYSNSTQYHANFYFNIQLWNTI